MKFPKRRMSLRERLTELPRVENVTGSNLVQVTIFPDSFFLLSFLEAVLRFS